MTSITDAEGSAGYTFDALGNKLSETDPLGNTLTFTYDAMSRMLTSTDADGYTTTYAYDALGNQTSITAPDGRRDVCGIRLRHRPNRENH